MARAGKIYPCSQRSVRATRVAGSQVSATRWGALARLFSAVTPDLSSFASRQRLLQRGNRGHGDFGHRTDGTGEWWRSRARGTKGRTKGAGGRTRMRGREHERPVAQVAKKRSQRRRMVGPKEARDEEEQKVV